MNRSDPDGTTVRWVGDRAAIGTAINYLNGSSTFAGIYSSLQNSSQVYTITTTSSINAYFTYTTGNIVWNPNLGLEVTSGEGIESAAMVLAHELAGHAEDWDYDSRQYLIDRIWDYLDNYDSQEEFNAVSIEKIIADELGEATRSDHRGTLISMNGPLDSRGGSFHIGTTGNVISGPAFGVITGGMPSWSIGGAGTQVEMSSVPGLGWIPDAHAMAAMNPGQVGGGAFFQWIKKLF